MVAQRPTAAEQRKRQLRAMEGPVRKKPAMRRPAAAVLARPAAAVLALDPELASSPVLDGDAAPVAEADMMVQAEPAVVAEGPAGNAEGPGPGLAYGCGKCRAAKIGCKRCRGFAARGYRGYYLNAEGHVVYPENS